MSNEISFPYEKQAQRGDEMPNGLDYPDQLLYQALAILYSRYYSGFITRDQASAEKKKLFANYKIYQYQWEMGDRWSNVIKATELARAEYRKNKTIENADKLVMCIDGVI